MCVTTCLDAVVWRRPARESTLSRRARDEIEAQPSAANASAHARPMPCFSARHSCGDVRRLVSSRAQTACAAMRSMPFVMPSRTTSLPPGSTCEVGGRRLRHAYTRERRGDQRALRVGRPPPPVDILIGVPVQGVGQGRRGASLAAPGPPTCAPASSTGRARPGCVTWACGVAGVDGLVNAVCAARRHR
jgi:hypothetical protein